MYMYIYIYIYVSRKRLKVPRAYAPLLHSLALSRSLSLYSHSRPLSLYHSISLSLLLSICLAHTLVLSIACKRTHSKRARGYVQEHLAKYMAGLKAKTNK